MNGESKMSFIEHLEELRKRLIYCVAAVFIGMFVCWFFRDLILAFLLSPLYEAWSQVEGLPEPQPLNFSNMLEPFVAYLKLSAVGGLFLGVPMILHQLWQFIAPGLYRRERRLAAPFVVISSILFIGGSVMAYAVVFPIGFKFFLEFAAGREMSVLESHISILDTGPDKAREMDAGPGEIQEKGERAGPSRVDASSPVPVDPIDSGLSDGGPDGAVVDSGPLDGGLQDGGTVDAAVAPPVPKEAALPEKMAPIEADVDAGPSESSENESEETWYEWLLGRLLKKECATFDIVQMPDTQTATVKFEWHTAQCGDSPKLDTLKRNEKPIALSWQTTKLSNIGYTTFTAEDRDLTPGEHIYSLRVPSDPSAHRLAPVLMIKDYLSFAIRLLLAFGLIFELPILISFLSLAGIVNYKQLLKFSRWFLVIAVFIGAMLTPPDVVTQLLLALPLMVLYFLSILVAYLFGPKPD